MQTPPERHSSCTWTCCLANHHRATAELTSLMLHVPFEASSTWCVGRFPLGTSAKTPIQIGPKAKNKRKWLTADSNEVVSSLIIENYREKLTLDSGFGKYSTSHLWSYQHINWSAWQFAPGFSEIPGLVILMIRLTNQPIRAVEFFVIAMLP